MRPDFLSGAIDLHIHSGPDVIERIGTSIDIAIGARDAGMRAIVLKDHNFPSFTKAGLTDQVVDGLSVYGGITLNTTVGGLNERAARGAVAGGAKMLMFPTYDLAHTAYSTRLNRLQIGQSFGQPYIAIPIVDDDGRLTNAADAIVRIAAENPQVVLSNGHLGGSESVAVMERARECGAERLVIEHPNAHPDMFSSEELKRLRELGAKFSISYNPYNPVMGRRNMSEAVELINFLGSSSCNLITDGGQPYNAMPYVTMQMFCEMLLVEGIAVDDLVTMVKVNPALLLGLDPVDG